jgi:glycosyltransferase involved in cell wall biosynthesis
MFRYYRLAETLDMIFTNTPHKREFTISQLGMAAEKVFCIAEQTDTEFFRPGPQSPGKVRPLIGSGGLEQRDYVTLAAATADKDLDVRISAVSPNAAARQDTFPDPLPANMVARHHGWEELRQLYRDADVFVISLKQNSYQAGLTTLMEAFACKTPVVMTRTTGSVEDFERAGALLAVPPNDAAALRAAIERLLADPDFAAEQVARAFDMVQRNHRVEGFIANIVERMKSL